MAARNAVEWHSHIARNFDKKYSISQNFRERYKIWTEIIDRYSKPSFDVLDVGCGSGIFTFYSAKKNKKVIGIDASKEMLRICYEKMENLGTRNVNFLNCNIETLGHQIDQKFDLIICSSVLEYIYDLSSTLVLIRHLTNRDGILLISMPNKQSIYRKIESLLFKFFGRPLYYKHIKNICTIREMEKKLKRVGFSILENKFYGETPLLSKIFRKIGVSHYSDNLYIIVAQASS